MLREFLAGALAQADVWVATGAQLAQWWSDQYRANETGHPVDLFAPLHVGAKTA